MLSTRVRMKPDNAAIKSVSPKLTASALVESGRQYAVYLHVPLPNKPKRMEECARSSPAPNALST